MVSFPRIGIVLSGNLNRLNGKQSTQLRHGHALSTSMPLPLPQRCQQALQQKDPAHRAGHIGTNPHRVATVRPQVARIAGSRLHHQLRRRVLGPWTVLAKWRQQTVDQTRIQLDQGRIVTVGLRRLFSGLIADDHVSEAGRVLHHLTSFGCAHVNRQTLFVAVES